MAVRENPHGRLVEKAAADFDLHNPLAIRPKRASVETTYGDRHAMPERVELDNVAFEGLHCCGARWSRRSGCPTRRSSSSTTTCDFALRARRAGFRIWAMRDAVLVRQLDFDQQHALDTWKGFYMYRNLFVVHFRYGDNAAGARQALAIAAAVVALSPVRGGKAEAGNVIRAIRSARGMRSIPGSGTPAR